MREVYKMTAVDQELLKAPTSADLEIDTQVFFIARALQQHGIDVSTTIIVHG
jgi:hypothetical protein